jgi:hypothetical protein
VELTDIEKRHALAAEHEDSSSGSVTISDTDDFYSPLIDGEKVKEQQPRRELRPIEKTFRKFDPDGSSQSDPERHKDYDSEDSQGVSRFTILNKHLPKVVGIYNTTEDGGNDGKYVDNPYLPNEFTAHKDWPPAEHNEILDDLAEKMEPGCTKPPRSSMYPRHMRQTAFIS